MHNSRLDSLGRSAWSAIGIIVFVVIIAYALGAVSGVVVPLLIAVILGTVLEPIANFLIKKGVKPTLATVVALLVAVLVGTGLIAVVVWGFIQQLPEISRQLTLGWNSFLAWGRSLDIDTVLIERIRLAARDYLPHVGQGAIGAVASSFNGLIAFAMGSFFGIFFLFFVLKDSSKFPTWLAHVIKRDEALVVEVVSTTKGAVRGYFRGTAITALITAPIFMIPLVALNVPLALPIFILYFFLSFIPFVGAWLTAGFAILIAFGSGGASAAGIVTLALLISNGTVQSAVSSWALGSSLKIHPVTVLLATLIGGTIAGILGMVLGAPLVAAVGKSLEVVRKHQTALADEPIDTIV